MYAWVKQKRAPGAVLVDDYPMPKIKDDEVLVKVTASSICGTDLHIWDWDQWAQGRIKKIPMIPGHELGGEVIKVGKEVTRIREGDFISAETHIFDNTCYQCLTGRKHICQNMTIFGVDIDGVFAEYVAIPAQNAWVNDKTLPNRLASIQEPLGNSVHSLVPPNNMEEVGGKTVAILGCGPTGLLAILVARFLGADKIYASDLGDNPSRLALAKKFGADRVFSVLDEGDQIVPEIMNATDGNGVDIALEMSGAPSALKQAFEVLTPGGRLSILALYNRPVELDITDWIVFKAPSIYGITGRRIYETWFRVKGLMRNPTFRERIKDIFSHIIPIHALDDGIELLHNKQATKISLDMKWS